MVSMTQTTLEEVKDMIRLIKTISDEFTDYDYERFPEMHDLENIISKIEVVEL